MTAIRLLIFYNLFQTGFSIDSFRQCEYGGWHCEHSRYGLNLTYICPDTQKYTFTYNLISSLTVFQLNLEKCKSLEVSLPKSGTAKFPIVLSVQDVKKLTITYENNDRRYRPREITMEHRTPRIINIANVHHFQVSHSATLPVNYITELNLTNVSIGCGLRFSVESSNWKNVNVNCSLGYIPIPKNLMQSYYNDPIPQVTEHATQSTMDAQELIWESVTVDQCQFNFTVKSLKWKDVYYESLNSTFFGSEAGLTWINVTVGIIKSTFLGSLHWKDVNIVNVEESSVIVKGSHTWDNIMINDIPKSFYFVTGNVTWNNLNVTTVSIGGIEVAEGDINISNSSINTLERKSINLQRTSKVIFSGNEIANLSKGAILVRTKEFTFEESNITEVQADAFDIVSDQIRFLHNIFGNIHAEAFSDVCFNNTNNKNSDDFHYLWKGNTIEKLEIKGLHPNFLSFHDMEGRIELIDNRLPCTCPLIPWSLDNQPAIHHYFYNILIRKEFNNTCLNADDCLLKTFFDLFPNGHCTDKTPTCHSNLSDSTTFHGAITNTNHTVFEVKSTTTPAKTITSTLSAKTIPTEVTFSTSSSTTRSTGTFNSSLTSENVTSNKKETTTFPSVVTSTNHPLPLSATSEIKQDATSTLLEEIIKKINSKEENSDSGNVTFVLIGLPMWILLVYILWSRHSCSLYKRSYMFQRNEGNSVDEQSL